MSKTLEIKVFDDKGQVEQEFGARGLIGAAFMEGEAEDDEQPVKLIVYGRFSGGQLQFALLKLVEHCVKSVKMNTSPEIAERFAVDLALGMMGISVGLASEDGEEEEVDEGAED